MNKIISLICGIIFGIGLTVSQMIDPAKVLGFLNIFGEWDPSLAFVMIGALIISSPFFHLFKNNKKPIFADKFSYSNNLGRRTSCRRKDLKGSAPSSPGPRLGSAPRLPSATPPRAHRSGPQAGEMKKA